MAARGLSVRTVSGALVHIRAVFELGIEDRIVLSNPARKVKPRGKAPAEKQVHTEAERAKVKTAAADEWLSACWLLTMAGLRRSEVLGLRWSDVDFGASTIAVRRGRVLVDAHTVDEGDPKTRSSARVLELSTEYMDALKAMRAEHVRHLGIAHMRDGYLAVNEFGQPVRPELYSDRWRRLCERAGVRALTLHEERHSSVSLLRAKGVPDQVIAAFHGHDEQTMRRTYSHLQPGDLRQAAAAL
jgi:integrase